MWRILARAGRIVAWVTLALVATVAALAIALFLFARSGPGRRRLARMIEPAISERLNGARVTIGRLKGNLTRQLVLEDVVVRDPDGAPAIQIRRLALDYRLLSLARRRVEITALTADGASVHLRRLPDGRLNLQALIGPARQAERPLAIELRHARLTGELTWKGTSVRVSARGALSREEGLPRVETLRVTAELPPGARLAINPRLALSGPIALRIHADGSLASASVHATVTPPRGSIAIAGRLGIAPGSGMVWNATLTAHGIDPATTIAGAPPGTVELQASAEGRGRHAQIAIAQLSARAAGTRVDAHGEVTLGPFGARGIIDADSRDLSRLATLGLPALAGQLSLHARVSRAQAHTRIDADLQGRKLEVATAAIGDLDAHLHARDLRGRARLHARDLIVPVLAKRAPLDLGEVDLALSGDRRALALTLDARGPAGTQVALAAHGIRLAGRRGADVTIDRLLAALRGQRWETVRPGRLHVERSEIAGALALGSGAERLNVDGRVGLESGALALEVEGERIDPRKIVALFRPELALPESRANFTLRLRGHRSAPIVDLHLLLQTGAIARLGLAPSQVLVDARYQDRRVHGSVTARTAAGPVAVVARATVRGEEARATLDARLRGAEVLYATLNGRLPSSGRLAERWREIPIELDARVPAYDLSRLPPALRPAGLAGVVAGELHLRGPLARPTGRGQVEVERLRVSETELTRLRARATLDGSALVAHLDASEPDGGALTFDAQIPVARAAPLSATLDARKLHVALDGVGPIRRLAGTLEARLQVHGTRASPSPSGELKVSGGTLALFSDPHLYRAIAIDLGVAPGRLTLRRAALQAGSGSAQATGSAELDGLVPRSFTASVSSQHFPIASGSVSAWIDSQLDVRGELRGRLITGVITVRKGIAHLPKLGGRKLQSTGPLADVVYVDAAARRAREARLRARREHKRVRVHVTAHVPGPFQVRSEELRSDLHGDLGIDLVGAMARISGEIQSSLGSVQLLHRRYTLEHARLGFAGRAPPDPNLDIRLTRALSSATLIIEVHGTARNPKLVLASDPPIYDQSQLVGIIVSGDPGSPRVSSRALDQMVLGAVSSVIVNRIKDQIVPGLPIDVISFEAGQADKGAAASRLEVGKYLTDDIFVSYVYQFGAPAGLRRVNSNEARLNYRFARRFEINTVYGDAGVGALDFYWTVRF